MPERRQPKSEFLQIRLTPKDKERVDQAATEDHLDPSTWVRQLVLRALDERERGG